MVAVRRIGIAALVNVHGLAFDRVGDPLRGQAVHDQNVRIARIVKSDREVVIKGLTRFHRHHDIDLEIAVIVRTAGDFLLENKDTAVTEGQVVLEVGKTLGDRDAVEWLRGADADKGVAGYNH